MDTVLFCASVHFLSAINIFFSCHSDSHSLHHFTVYIFSVYSAIACVILDACLIYHASIMIHTCTALFPVLQPQLSSLVVQVEKLLIYCKQLH